MIINQLLQCCSPIIECIAFFIRNDKDADCLLNFREKMITAFTVMDQKSAEFHSDHEQMLAMKYVMAALVDEIILHSHWEGRTDWMSRTMQLQFFGEHIAGEKFFARLNALRQDSYKNIDLLEGYYLCLQFGFAGVYRVREPEQLQALQVGLRDQIEKVRGDYAPNLMTAQTGEITTEVLKQFDLPIWRVLILLLCISMVVYVSSVLIINKRAQQALLQIHAYRDLMSVL